MAKFVINGPDQPPPKRQGKENMPPTKAGSQAARSKMGASVDSASKQPSGGKRPPQKL